MSRFHINKHGVPAPCKAKPGNCPLGGDDQHFKTKEEAQAYADKINEQKHSLLPQVENVTGDTPMEHKTQLKMMSIYDEAIDALDDYTSGSEYAPETSEVDPVNQAEKYFDAVIRKHSGENVDLNKYDFDWVEEVEDNQDSYMSLTNAYSRTAIEPEYGWDSSSDEAYYDDLSKAEDTNEFFEGRKEFIHDMVKKVQKVDWTQYGMNQKEGEIEALKFLKDGDLMGT